LKWKEGWYDAVQGGKERKYQQNFAVLFLVLKFIQFPCIMLTRALALQRRFAQACCLNTTAASSVAKAKTSRAFISTSAPLVRLEADQRPDGQPSGASSFIIISGGGGGGKRLA